MPALKTKLPKGVRFQRYVLKSTGEVVRYGYYGKGKDAVRRALILAVETGQRQGDLLVLPWSAVKGDVIELRQSKTDQPVAIPISATLRECLAACPRSDSTTILTRSDGKPWEPRGNGFRAAWRDACKAAGVSGVTFHDLRGTFVTRRLAEGWNTMEVAICTGHSLRDLRMLDSYADRGKVASAMARRVADRLAENEAATKTSK